jgi:hypothetical protein
VLLIYPLKPSVTLSLFSFINNNQVIKYISFLLILLLVGTYICYSDTWIHNGLFYSPSTASFKYYMLFPVSVLLFLLSFDMFLSPSSHSCVWLLMRMYICTRKNSLEYCPFFKQSLCYLFWFHLCILFPKNKSTLFSTSVFHFVYVFCLKRLTICVNAWFLKCLLFLSIRFHAVISVEWSLCVHLPFSFLSNVLSFCMDFCILQYINLYIKNIYTFATVLV